MIPSKTPEELKQIAIDIRANRIFCDRHCRSLEEVPMSFMVLMLLDDEQREQLKGVGMIYEHMSKAMPMGCNGMPCFMSYHQCSIEDTKKVFEYYDKLEAAEKAILA